MCGIVGIVGPKAKSPAISATLSSMMNAVRHRGPDDEGTLIREDVALGHKRLSIIDLETGHQPMCNEDESIWIVFNGEIYNYQELRRDLSRSHSFRTHSDTEVILRLYEEVGERCLDRMNGMFAFAIWDRNRRRLFAARDRLGIKPFYWSFDGETLIFSSEPKALFASRLIRAETDPDGLEQYLNFQFCLGDQTMFRGVSRLEPGHFLSFRPARDNSPNITQYWDFNYQIDTHHTEEYYADQLMLLLQDAVRLQLRSDVPVGAHLSGGIDSSTVVCLASKTYGGDFHTFTGAFREGSQYDETRFARSVAEHVESIHSEVWPSAQEFADSLPRLVYMMDEPAAGPGIFPQYCVSKLARQHVKVVLGGQGGDEIFGGYARYLVAYLEQCLKGSILGIQDEKEHVVTWDSIAPNLPLLKQYTPLLKSFWQDGLFDDMDARYFRLVSRSEDYGSVISPEVWSREAQLRMFIAFREVFNNASTKSYFNKMTNFDLKTLLPALLQVEDRTSMSVSLESRVPLLDHRIVELVTRMPPAIRFKGGDTKRVFRDAVRHVLPKAVYERKDKMGFPVPLADWFQGSLRSFIGDILLSERCKNRGIFSADGVQRLIDREQPYGRQIWGLLNLELWFRACIDGEQLEFENGASEAQPVPQNVRN